MLEARGAHAFRSEARCDEAVAGPGCGGGLWSLSALLPLRSSSSGCFCARGDESGVRRGSVHRNSWQGTIQSSNEHLSSARGAAEVTDKA